MRYLLRHGGLYEIRCNATGDFYVGSTNRFSARWSYHRARLRRGAHDNTRLQRAWSEHGEGAFAFRVLCVMESTDRFAAEQRLLDAVVGAGCYNVVRDVGA